MKEETHKKRFKYMKVLKSKYLYYSIGILVLIGLVFVLYSYAQPGIGKLELELEDNRISSEESTNMRVKIHNTGDEPFDGYFNLTVDDSESVNITIGDDRKQVSLRPGERVERITDISAVSKAYRTDYEITGSLVINGSIESSDSTILSVRKS